MTKQEVDNLVEEMKLQLGLMKQADDAMIKDAMLDMAITGTGITLSVCKKSDRCALMNGSTLTFNDEEQWSPDVLKTFEDHPMPAQVFGRILVEGDDMIPESVQPQLPPEVHHTQEFNASAAWEAVVALARGSGC